MGVSPVLTSLYEVTAHAVLAMKKEGWKTYSYCSPLLIFFLRKGTSDGIHCNLKFLLTQVICKSTFPIQLDEGHTRKVLLDRMTFVLFVDWDTCGRLGRPREMATCLHCCL